MFMRSSAYSRISWQMNYLICIVVTAQNYNENIQFYSINSYCAHKSKYD